MQRVPDSGYPRTSLLEAVVAECAIAGGQRDEEAARRGLFRALPGWQASLRPGMRSLCPARHGPGNKGSGCGTMKKHFFPLRFHWDRMDDYPWRQAGGLEPLATAIIFTHISSSSHTVTGDTLEVTALRSEFPVFSPVSACLMPAVTFDASAVAERPFAVTFPTPVVTTDREKDAAEEGKMTAY